MRTFTKPVLLFVGIAVSILVRQQMSGAETVTLQNIRWQPLPTTVRDVFVAPDGRIWYCDESPTERHPTVVDLKRMIAGEFQQPTSQIDVIEPVLFEPSGRVWFSLRRANHYMLVGYDGKKWLDYAIADKTNIVFGECATDGRLNEGRANRCRISSKHLRTVALGKYLVTSPPKDGKLIVPGLIAEGSFEPRGKSLANR